MREIKFKGKRKDNGEWAYGWYAENPNGEPVIYSWHNPAFPQIVDPATVGQSTGFKDKNGKEDWVGDMVKAQVGGITFEREIVQAESGAYCISLPTIGATGGESLIMLITCEHENIGNIHDSPEQQQPCGPYRG